MQLASKMRFLAAQFDALLTDELWLRYAAPRQRDGVAARGRGPAVEGVTITRPGADQRGVRRAAAGGDASAPAGFDFYVWDEQAGEVRWMCSWDTTEEDVDEFAAAVRGALA